VIERIQHWSQSYRDRGKYTPVGVAFHWIMAALVIYQLYSGWTMQRYLVGAEKLEAYRLHSEIGLTLLSLGVARLIWRLIVPGPINDADKPGWPATIAHAIHIAFYALFAILPLSGWALWSAIQPAEPLYLAGLVPVPIMPFQDFSPELQQWVMDTTLNIHVACVILLTVLVIGHAGAAIKHHFWDRDDVFAGMLPEIPDTQTHPAGPDYSHRPGSPPPRSAGG
jgi:cytochrome b561